MSPTTHNTHANGSHPPAPGPLEGIRVLDLGTVYAAPIAAMLLGDYGADVIKVEHPRGDPARTHGHNKDGHGLWWKVISRNKRTVTLNLGRPEGRELLEGLVAEADVLIENFRPGVMEKWGLGPDRLHELAERPAWVRINALRTELAAADLDAVGGLAAGLRLPKVESAEDVGWVTARAPGTPLICAIESARGLLAAEEIAAAPPIDSVYARLDDEVGLRGETEHAHSLGFFGKSAIHPRQLAVLHQVFTPSEAEVAWAHEVLDAFAAAGGGAARLADGEFVDLPVAERARRVLAPA
jgi:hypothetical protein